MSESADSVSEEYYDSDSADSFYREIWGGDDIHIGIYEQPGESIYAASSRTVASMARHISDIGKDTKVLDLGAGYGGAARHLVALYECHVDCLNISEVQNEANRQRCEANGLADKVEVVHGSFEDIPGPADAYDVVWSQDSFLHSGNRRKVLQEIARVSRPGAQLVFTDPMQTDDCPEGVLQPVLDRIHLDTLGSPGFYREELGKLGFEEASWTPMPEQLRNHYASVAAELDARRDEMVERCGPEYVKRMREGLQHWVDAADRGHLTWGIFHFRLTG